ncbi:MAG: hypothetical protein Ta2B_17000 [Termitinemataceae bacterium]|nr:MAG: hypothetical protein Ta2B_17000 [Termitinemataceae bacterium]
MIKNNGVRAVLHITYAIRCAAVASYSFHVKRNKNLRFFGLSSALPGGRGEETNFRIL